MSVDAIRQSYVLKGLNEDQLARVVNITVVKDFRGGDVVVRQFAKSDDVMIVLEGMVRINTFSGEKIAECSVGSVVGEMSLIDNQPRSATVVSVGTSKVALIAADELWMLMDADPILAKTILLNIGRVLCMRLRNTNIQLDLNARHAVIS